MRTFVSAFVTLWTGKNFFCYHADEALCLLLEAEGGGGSGEGKYTKS